MKASNQINALNDDKSACSIIIRAYNEEKHIGRLLHGIMEQTVRDVEIILVDSGSNDSTIDNASRYPVKILNISSDNFSFGRSLNLGCNEASNEYIVIASAHIYPLYKDWLERLIEPFKDQKVCLVYGRQVGGESTKISERQIFNKWFPNENNYNQTYPFCNNANSAIRKSAWAKNNFDESLTGLEDLAWAKKALEEGDRIAYQAEATIVHEHNEKPMQIFNRYKREAIAMKNIYPNEKFTLIDFKRLFLTNVASDLLHASKKKQLMAHWADIISFRFMQFWGTFRGYAASGRISNKLRRRFYYPNHKDHFSCQRSEKTSSESLLIEYPSKDCF